MINLRFLKFKKKQSKYAKYYYRGYGYSYGSDGKSGGLCSDMNFTTAEAYKMLRTKLNLVLPGDISGDQQGAQTVHVCKVVGVTSALPGEGKTTTSVNLAYTISESGHKVCLIGADMRLPSLAGKLSLEKAPGLSNVLTGQTSVRSAIQHFTSKDGCKVDVITAGDVPPKPSELLESKNMKLLLEKLRSLYDYVIVDLPPVNVVTDAIAVSGYLDGMLLVVRQDHCDRSALRETIYQFQLTKTEILGVIMNCSDGPSGRMLYNRRGSRYKADPYGSGYAQAGSGYAKAGRGLETKHG